MSSASSSASSKNGARPKTPRNIVHHQGQGYRPYDNGKEWNSDWNPALSAQGIATIRNGQPPSASASVAAAGAHLHAPPSRQRMPVNGGMSDPSLGLNQPVTVSALQQQQHKEHQQQMLLDQLRLRRRADRSADLCQSSSTLSSNTSLNTKESARSSKSGIASWFRWFRRSNRQHRTVPPPQPRSTSGSRSHSVENSPLTHRRRPYLTGSSGALDSDSMSTASFAFVPPSTSTHSTNHNNNEITLRRKYGLPRDDDTVGATAIRAMRTEWELQMMQRHLNEPLVQSTTSSQGRKKRPAPPPPPPPAVPQRMSSHVPGKRKAPEPPSADRPLSTSNSLNIPPPSAPEVEPNDTTNSKWTNDLSSNLNTDGPAKEAIQQSKIAEAPCLSNDILKLEGGVLKPAGQQRQESLSPTLDGHHRMLTLPLKPWYKRNGAAHHQGHHPPRSKWKDAALPSLGVDDSLPRYYQPTCLLLAAQNQAVSSPPSTLQSVRSGVSSPGASSNSSGDNKKRHSLLVNISQLDKEAGEIIQRERERQSQRRKEHDARFYGHAPVVPVTTENGREVEEQDDAPAKNVRQVIDMFNSFNTTRVTINPNLLADAEAMNSNPPLQQETPAPVNVEAMNRPAAEDRNASEQQERDITAERVAEPLVDAPPTASHAISRLRVNRESVPVSLPITNGESSSIFNPRLAVLQPPPVEYPGGARPKRSTTTQIEVPATSGWACHICTLVNSDARLWCEACTALKPRQPPKTEQTKPKYTVVPASSCLGPPPLPVFPKSNPPTANSASSSSSSSSAASKTPPPPPTAATTTTVNDNSTARLPVKWEDEIRKYFDAGGSSRGSSGPTPPSAAESKLSPAPSPAPVRTRPVDAEPNNKDPPTNEALNGRGEPSPEALRQARLAFFANNDKKARQSEDVQRQAKPEDYVQNRGQPVTKVSSGCQTQSSLGNGSLNKPKQGVDPINSTPPRPLSMDGRHKTARDDHKPPMLMAGMSQKSPPCSRSQLSRYIQQRDQELMATRSAAATDPPVAQQPSNDGPGGGLTDEKRVQVLLWRLEEAISSGQFDKAAVLAKELAAINRPTPTAPATPWATARQDAVGINGKPVAKPRSTGTSPAPSRRKSIDSQTPVVLPVPAKRTSIDCAAPVVTVEPAKTAEALKVIEPLKASKPILVTEPAVSPEPVRMTESKKMESARLPEPVTAADNVQTASGEMLNEPTSPASAIGASRVPEPARAPESQQLTVQPIKTADHVQITQPATAANAVCDTEPSTAVDPVKEIEQIRRAELAKEVAPARTTDGTGNNVQIESPNVPKPTEGISLQRILSKEPQQKMAAKDQQPVAVVQVHLQVQESVQVKKQAKTKRSKVDSGQQTTITYRKSATSTGQTQPQPDDTFNVEIFIERRSEHSGPFSKAVQPGTTMLQLKEMVEKEQAVPVNLQRWILGRKLANQDAHTLRDYDINPSNRALYLYVLEPKAELTAPVIEVEAETPSEPAPPVQQEQQPQHHRQYYNYDEDRYSTCDESDVDQADPSTELAEGEKPSESVKEPVAPQTSRVETVAQIHQPPSTAEPKPDGWICPGCTLLNPLNRPGCEVCATGRPGRSDEPPVSKTMAAESLPANYQQLLQADVSDAVPNAEAIECPVCLMAVPKGIGVVLRDCLHSFCRDCLAHVIEFSDEAAVSCPYRDENYACDSTLQEREIKTLVDPNVYEKHLARSVRLAEKSLKNAFHCQTSDCTGWAVIEDNVNVFRCPVCKKSNCLTCQAIHEGVNCKQYQDRVAVNAETDEDAKRTKEMIDALMESGEALACPHCQVVLMKRFGCDWVRCSVCRTEICWVTKRARWGPKGRGDTSGGCQCGLNGVKCHPKCNYCH